MTWLLCRLRENCPEHRSRHSTTTSPTLRSVPSPGCAPSSISSAPHAHQSRSATASATRAPQVTMRWRRVDKQGARNFILENLVSALAFTDTIRIPQIFLLCDTYTRVTRSLNLVGVSPSRLLHGVQVQWERRCTTGLDLCFSRLCFI